jgi:hypothetical protein
MISDEIYFSSYINNGKIISISQSEGILSSLGNIVKNYVSSIYDKEHPYSSILSFLGSGMLFSLGLPKLSILYELAEALGFDWKSFWSNLGNAIISFTKSSSNPTEQEIASNVNSIVDSSLKSSFSGNVDKSKLSSIIKSSETATELRKLAEDVYKNRFIKTAGIASTLIAKLYKFFSKIISFVVKSALMSTVFETGRGITTNLLGIKTPQSKPQDFSNAPIYKLQVSPTVSEDIFESHRNDLSNVWIEHGDINDIENIISSWILSTYPQLNKDIDKIKSSNTFQSIVNQFKDRNKLASGLGIFSIPRPYEKKIDIVSKIVNDYLG